MASKRLVLGIAAVVAVSLVVAYLWLRDTEKPLVAPAPAQPQGEVLLVPGYGGGTGPFQALARDLSSQGIKSEIIDVDNGEGDLRQYADRVTHRAQRLVDTGHPAPDVVGYSAGGLTARIAATDQPQLFNRVITLATPHAGTSTAELGALFADCPEACQQMRPESELLTSLPAPTNPRSWLSIWSDTDEVIRPPDSSVLPDVGSYRLQDACPGPVGHGEIPLNGQVRATIEAFLEGNPLPASCALPG